MRITLAYLSLILLWSTTPLAIQWSSRDVGFVFGATARMTVALLVCLVLLKFQGQSLNRTRSAIHNYLAVAMQFYASMMMVCWGAQYVPSGWVSAVFGLVPLLTALIAALVLKEQSLSPLKLLAYISGLGGLILIFGSARQMGLEAVQAVAGLLLGALFQVSSAVWVKKINSGLPALNQVTGGLLIAVPLYWLTWLVFVGKWPTHISQLTLAAIVYLAILATTFGFSLYYYVIKHLAATRVALISLITPVLALLVGHRFNHEPISMRVAVGVALILAGLLIHESAERRSARRRPK